VNARGPNNPLRRVKTMNDFNHSLQSLPAHSSQSMPVAKYARVTVCEACPFLEPLHSQFWPSVEFWIRVNDARFENGSSRGQNLAVTALFVQRSLDSGKVGTPSRSH